MIAWGQFWHEDSGKLERHLLLRSLEPVYLRGMSGAVLVWEWITECGRSVEWSGIDPPSADGNPHLCRRCLASS